MEQKGPRGSGPGQLLGLPAPRTTFDRSSPRRSCDVAMGKVLKDPVSVSITARKCEHVQP